MVKVQIVLLLCAFLLVSGERRERKEGLKWFPANEKEECKQVPEQVEVEAN